MGWLSVGVLTRSDINQAVLKMVSKTYFFLNGGFYVVKVVHYIVLISCCELTVFCITDLSLELFTNVLKAGFLIMWLFKVGGGGGVIVYL